MKIHTIQPTVGATTPAKRLGRGIGSGLGKTSGKGHKGQWARSGGGVRPGFEGGQSPLARRIPKRGFNNYEFETTYNIVNLDVLNQFENGATVTPEVLFAAGLVTDKKTSNLKVLGGGSLSKKLTVKAHKFSASAKAAIENAGGTVEVIK